MLPAAQVWSNGWKTAIIDNNVSFEAICRIDFNMQQGDVYTKLQAELNLLLWLVEGKFHLQKSAH